MAAPRYSDGDDDEGEVAGHTSSNGDSPMTTRAPPRKRRRIVVSCTECHRRKQKCDRELPCANCKSRNKESACRYEEGAPTAKERGKASLGSGEASPKASRGGAPAGEMLSTAAADWGYSQTGATTLGFLRKIEGANGDSSVLAALNAGGGNHTDDFGLRDRYKSLIRQLPAKVYIEKLVDVYFKEFNWQYYPLDYDLFLDQLAEWNQLPFHVFSNNGPMGLGPDLRVFPALLFQVLACALLILPDGQQAEFEALKYAGNMTFEDLAVDYSESGVSMLSILGKRQITLTTVQAGFLRAAVLKYLAKVTESWHAIGSAIRDAQEIGMHRDSLDPQPASQDIGCVLENQWLIQRRRRLYMILTTWDLHTATVLGRPGAIDGRILPPSLPVDAPLPKDRSKTPVVVRDEERDPPTPLTRAIVAFKLMSPMRDIIELEKDGPCPKDYTKVDEVHQLCMDLIDVIPPYFRQDNPDTRWDNHPDCWWIPAIRLYLPPLHLFNLMALHRPYVFNRPKSREEALKASIDMLHSQKLSFKGTPSNSWKNFSLFFGSFDAVVLMASIYILFPKENQDLAGSAMQHFHWTTERFESMAERNRLAKSARAVLQAIYAKFRKAIGNPMLPPIQCSYTTPTPSTAPSSYADSRAASTSISTPSSKTTASAFTPSEPAETVASATSSYPPPSATTEWTMPSDFDFTSITPLYPMADIIYNDVTGIPDGSDLLPSWGGTDVQAPEMNIQPWQFEGDFGSDSVWSLLNQYKLGPY